MVDITMKSVDNPSLLMKYPLFEQPATGDAPLLYSAKDFRAVVDVMFPQGGVISGVEIQQHAAGPHATLVKITSGVMVVPTPQGNYIVKVIAPIEDFSIYAAPVSGAPRIHVVVAEIMDKADNPAVSEYGWQLHVLEDTGGGGIYPSGSLVIGSVTRTVGDTGITTAKINNTLRIRAGSAGQGTVGGRVFANTGAQVGGIYSSPTLIPGFEMIGVTTITGRRYRISAVIGQTVSANGASDVLFINENTVSGPQVAEVVYDGRRTNTFYATHISDEFNETNGGTKNYVLGTYSWMGSPSANGAATHDLKCYLLAPGQKQQSYFRIEDIGPAI